MHDDSTDTRVEAAAIAAIGHAALAAHVERSDVFLLDVRKHARGGQIYGAIRYDPKKLLDAERLILPLPKTDGTIVLYDEHGDSRALNELAAKVRDNGYAGVRVLEGGYAAWEKAGGRMEDPTLEQPVPLVSEHQINR